MRHLWLPGLALILMLGFYLGPYALPPFQTVSHRRPAGALQDDQGIADRGGAGSFPPVSCLPSHPTT